MSIKKFSFLVLFSTLSLFIYGEQNEIDSLESLLPNTDDTTEIKILVNLVHHYSYLDHYKALSYAKKALILSDELSYSKGRSAILSEIGLIFMIRGNYNKALRYFNFCLTSDKKSDNLSGIESNLNKIGIVYKDKGEYETAKGYFTDALEISEQIDNKKGQGYIHNNLGLIAYNQSDNRTALSMYSKAFKIHRAIENDRGAILALNNIAVVYSAIKNYKLAIESFEKCLKLNQKINDKRGQAMALGNIAIVYKEKKEYKKALKYDLKSLNLYKEIGSKLGISRNYSNIGNTYMELGKYQDAISYQLKSIELSEKLNNPLSVVISFNNLAQTYLLRNDFKKAEECAHKSMILAKEINANIQLIDIQSLLSRALFGQKKFKEAYHHEHVHDSIKFNHFTLEKESNVKELQIKYETEKKEKEIAKLKLNEKLSEDRANKLQLYISSGITVSLLLFLTFYMKLKRKENYYQEEINQLILLKKEAELEANKANNRLEKFNKKENVASITIKSGKKLIVKPISEILYFKAEDKYVFLFDKLNKPYITDLTLSYIEKAWPNNFIRIHRSYVINKNKIKEIAKGHRGKFVFTMESLNNYKVLSSRNYSSVIKDEFKLNKFTKK